MLDAYDQTALNLARRGNRGSISRIKKRLSCVKTSGLFGDGNQEASRAAHDQPIGAKPPWDQAAQTPH